jgi:hypothetical protein
MSSVEILTLWKTAHYQCEVVRGAFFSRLRLWRLGTVVVNEEILDLGSALRRAHELWADVAANDRAKPSAKVGR